MVKKRDDSVDIDTKDAHHKTKDKSEDDVTHDKSIIVMITIESYLFVDKTICSFQAISNQFFPWFIKLFK